MLTAAVPAAASSMVRLEPAAEFKVRVEAPVMVPTLDREPELMTKLLMVLVAVGAVMAPAEVMVPVPVVLMLPVVEMVILAARSPPTTEEKVGRPEALPWRTVV